MVTSSSSSFLFSVPSLERQATRLLIIMSETDYQQSSSPAQGFVTALTHALKTGPHMSDYPSREPVVTAVPVNGQQDVGDWSAVVEDVADLLFATSSVLLVPWLPGLLAPAHLLDQLQASLSGSVQERTFVRPTVSVKRAAPFGPWNQPVNPQQQLDRYLLWYPGWHDCFTCVEASAGQRVTVLWRRGFSHPPLSAAACQTAMTQAWQLLTAAITPRSGRPSRLYRDGSIYLDYLCTLVGRTCTMLEEQPRP